MKKISETVHSVHYERKVVLVRVLWTCSRKGNHNWRERRTEGGLEKQTTFRDVTEGSILWHFLLVYFITTYFHSHRLFPGRLWMYFNEFIFEISLHLLYFGLLSKNVRFKILHWNIYNFASICISLTLGLSWNTKCVWDGPSTCFVVVCSCVY